jgi:hypothetical protein
VAGAAPQPPNIVDIAVAAANAKTILKTIAIEFRGTWQDDPVAMFGARRD